MKKIKSKISIIKTRKKIVSKNLNLFVDEFKNTIREVEVHRTGYCFCIDPDHKSIYLNGRYLYFDKKNWNKFVRDLERIISYENKK